MSDDTLFGFGNLHPRRAPAWALAPQHSGGFASGCPWWDSARCAAANGPGFGQDSKHNSSNIEQTERPSNPPCVLGIFHQDEILAMLESFTSLRNEPFKTHLPPLKWWSLSGNKLMVGWFLLSSSIHFWASCHQSPWPGHLRSKLHKWDPHGTRCSAAHRGTRPGPLRHARVGSAGTNGTEVEVEQN